MMATEFVLEKKVVNRISIIISVSILPYTVSSSHSATPHIKSDGLRHICMICGINNSQNLVS